MLKPLWPTSRGWLILLVGALWLLIAMVNHGMFALVLAWGCFSMWLASLVVALCALRGLEVSRGPMAGAKVGQMLTLPLRWRNRKRWRSQAVVVQEELPFTLEKSQVHVKAPQNGRTEEIFERPVLPVRRGEYHLDALVLRSGDPAGLFMRERRLRLPATLVVYPPVELLPDLLLQQREVLASASGHPISAAGMSQDFYGVREYVPSDGMRRIHWRSSARFGKLMVKEFERNAVSSVAVLLDADERCVSDAEWSNLEYLVCAAASICSYCADLYCSFAFAAGGAQPILVRPRAASEAKEEIMYLLATLAPGKNSLVEPVAELSELLPRNTVVFCLTLGGASKEMREMLEGLLSLGMDIRWYNASREAFQPKRKKQEEPSQPEAVSGVLRAVEVYPKLNLKAALASW